MAVKYFILDGKDITCRSTLKAAKNHLNKVTQQRSTKPEWYCKLNPLRIIVGFEVTSLEEGV